MSRKQMIIETIILAVIFTCAGLVLAHYVHANVTKTVQATFEYPTPPADLAGFRLYMDGDVVCEAPPGARTMECETTVGIPDSAPTMLYFDFHMTAYDTAGNESAASETIEVGIEVDDVPPPVLNLQINFVTQ